MPSVRRYGPRGARARYMNDLSMKRDKHIFNDSEVYWFYSD